MKKVLFTLGVVFISLGAKAQIDLSINPIAILFGSFDIPIEYCVTNDIGIELTPSYSFNKYTVNGDEYKNSGFGARLIGKYYFSPENGCDKWNIGPYIRYEGGSLKYENDSETRKVTTTRLAVGFYAGYKWVSRKNIIFELGLGVGKALVNNYSTDDDSIDLDDFSGIFNIDATGKLAVGYRFGGSK